MDKDRAWFGGLMSPPKYVRNRSTILLAKYKSRGSFLWHCLEESVSSIPPRAYFQFLHIMQTYEEDHDFNLGHLESSWFLQTLPENRRLQYPCRRSVLLHCLEDFAINKRPPKLITTDGFFAYYFHQYETIFLVLWKHFCLTKVKSYYSQHTFQILPSLIFSPYLHTLKRNMSRHLERKLTWYKPLTFYFHFTGEVIKWISYLFSPFSSNTEEDIL